MFVGKGMEEERNIYYLLWLFFRGKMRGVQHKERDTHEGRARQWHVRCDEVWAWQLPFQASPAAAFLLGSICY
jgi:hypothetical protein